MARRKEPHFFDNEAVDWSRPNFDDYHQMFDPPSAETLVVGDATPIYSYWPNCLGRIAAYNSDARFVLCLRYPVYRAHSHWRMETLRKAETMPFAAAIREGRERVRAASNGAHRVFSYVERGFYAEQIERLLQLFPQRSLLALRTESLWHNPSGTLSSICAFLGIPSDAEGLGGGYIVPSDAKGGPLDSRDLGIIDEESRLYLFDLYREDIQRTAILTGLDLSDWLTPSFHDPMS
jgi:hypothetical protein